MSGVTIYDVNGQPMVHKPSKASMLNGGGYGAPAFDAADIFGDHTREWNPGLFSPDGETAFTRDRIVSRVRDLVRNDGWASGAITRLLDNTIGGNFRPIMKPDFKALAHYTGNKAFDADWAHEFGRALEVNYGHWGNDPNKWCDASRAMTMPQMLGVAYRHKLIDGDALCVLPWLDERVRPGRARYATTVQLIDPDRLSNPQNMLNALNMRNGVEIDEHGAAQAYWIRKAHQGDYWAGVNSAVFERMDRETSWGRPVTVLDYENDRAGQHRGGAGVLTAVVTRLKMLFRYDTAELDSAIVNAIHASYIESPFDPEIVKEAMGDDDSGRLNEYQSMRADYRKDHPVSVGNTQTLHLFPGEKFDMTTAARPNPNFAGFEKAVLRNVASAGGLSSMQVTNDWSDVNYSSARGALMEFWKTTSRRRHNFALGFAHPILQAFAEESFEVDSLPLPPGAPEFAEMPSAYCRAKWIGPPRGWMDPSKEIEGAILGLSAGLMDFDEICAEQGVEADDMIAARAQLKKRFEAAGAELPSYLMPASGPPKPSGQVDEIEQPKVTP